LYLGANTAQLLQLKVGDTFSSAHGLSKEGHAHDENPFVVTGILKRTTGPLDNLILTNVSSIWKVHDAHVEDSSNVADTLSSHSVLVPTAMVAGFNTGNNFLVN
jgi:putative ABC transport system permease protein